MPGKVLFAFCYNAILKYTEPSMKFSYHKKLIINLINPLGLMILYNKYRGYKDTRWMTPFTNNKTNLKWGSCIRTTDSFLEQPNRAIKEVLLDQRRLKRHNQYAMDEMYFDPKSNK